MNKKIQMIRAIAIIAVVIIHTIPGGREVIIRPFVNFAVALFIFLSGYLTRTKIDNIIFFYKKRILRVLIPYIIWSLIHTIISSSYVKFPLNLVTAQANSIYYYILVYIQLMMFTPIIGKWIESRFSIAGWFVTPISIMCLRYIPAILGYAVYFPFNESCCLLWFIYYYLGMALGNHIIEIDKKKYRVKGMLIGCGVLLVISEIEGYIWYLNGNQDMAITQIKFTSLLTSMTICILSYFFIEGKYQGAGKSIIKTTLIKIGDCSFGIYLSHVAVMMVLNKIPGYILLVFPVNTIVVLTVSTLCVIWGNKILGEKMGRYLGLN